MSGAAYYNEIDPYAAQWLRNLISAGHIAPGDVDERSIVDVQPDDLKGYTQCHFFAGIGGWSYAARLAGWPDSEPLWTGSCPCQPFSVAGKGEGKADERHLWPIFFALIRARRPAVVMGEQVAAAVGKDWLDGVHSDLESIGYASGASVVPACAVDAPHRRDRLWFVANSDAQSVRGRRSAEDVGTQGAGESEGKERQRLRADPGHDLHHVDHSLGSGLEGQRRYGHDRGQSRWFDPQQVGSVAAAGGSLPNTDFLSESQGREQRSWELGGIGGNSRNWPWAGSEWAVGADGKARRVEPGIRLLAHGVPARVGKLRAYGNAIVPQVAAEVIGAYIDAYGLPSRRAAA